MAFSVARSGLSKSVAGTTTAVGRVVSAAATTFSRGYTEEKVCTVQRAAQPQRDVLIPKTHEEGQQKPSTNKPITLPVGLYPTEKGSKMMALVKKERKTGLWLEEVEKPLLQPDEVLIRVKRASICGTDLHIYNWDDWSSRTVPTPMTIGHEYSGVVAAVGDRVKGFEVGDRVTGEGHVTCGHCRNCRAGRRHLCRNTVGVGVNRPGAFGEFIALPAVNAFKLPAEISDEVGSIMDPLGNAIHCALSFDLVGEDVLITGAGPIGIMACAVAKHIGARHVVITDVNDYRLNLAKACGADVALNVGKGDSKHLLKSTMHSLGMTEGFDIGLEMSGYGPALKDMLDHLNNGAKVSLLGIPAAPFPIELDSVVFKGIHLKGIYGREMFETWYKMKNMLVGGLNHRIAPVITHRFNATDFQIAFDALKSGNAGKVVMNFEKSSGFGIN